MAGLRNICRMYGGMKASDGKTTINYVWDYANDEPVDEKDMTPARKEASDKAWAELMKKQMEQPTTSAE